MTSYYDIASGRVCAQRWALFTKNTQSTEKGALLIIPRQDDFTTVKSLGKSTLFFCAVSPDRSSLRIGSGKIRVLQEVS